MSNKTQKKNSLYSKIKDLNGTINTMLDGVKHLEKMRAYNYPHAINDEELQEVLIRMKRLEESLEKLEKPKKQDNIQKDTSHLLLKAVGKNRKLLVTKPVIKNNKTQDELQEDKRLVKNIISNSNTSKPKIPIEKLFDKNVTSESYHREAKQRARKLAFKWDK